MDIVKQKQIREWTLLGLVGVMALVGNLPRNLLDSVGVKAELLMGVLGLMVVLALFLYVRFFFFLLYALLAIGANLPEKWADGLGISQTPLLVTLITMVALSLLNYGAKMLPSGLEPKIRKQNPEATRVLLNAIERGNIAYVKTVLGMDFDLDTIDDEGMSPLMRAAQRGNLKIVQMILKRGASPSLGGPYGRASDVALRNNFSTVIECLRRAEEAEANEAAGRVAAEPQVDSAIVA
ncbi:MAG: ankyrin repeat domain-containing protein [Sulfuritalea sp.]|nr:ankyrin repeat domain-containing protein [Sulfuritalea sp.]